MKVTKKANEQPGYFFWKYDQFPYLLGGEGWLRPDGVCEIPAFGNATFKPKYTFFDIEKGKDVQRQLDEIEHDRDVAIGLINEASGARLDALFRGVE